MEPSGVKTTPVPVSVPLDAGVTTALVYPADRPTAALILAHGAGAGQRHTFITSFARALAGRGLDIITFNFPYMEQGRRLPDRPAALEACYRCDDRDGSQTDHERARAAVHRRQINGWTDRNTNCGRGSVRYRCAGWCCSAILFIHPADPTNRAIDTFLPSAVRCCSCRAAATRSARQRSSHPSFRRFSLRRYCTSSNTATIHSIFRRARPIARLRRSRRCSA